MAARPILEFFGLRLEKVIREEQLRGEDVAKYFRKRPLFVTPPRRCVMLGRQSKHDMGDLVTCREPLTLRPVISVGADETLAPF